MQWQDSEFQHHADAYLESLFEQLEDQDYQGALDMDMQDGVLMIEVDGQTFVINKHAPTHQVWLSSPLTGGLHFSPADGGMDWALPDGRRLSVVLGEELSMVTGVEFEIDV